MRRSLVAALAFLAAAPALLAQVTYTNNAQVIIPVFGNLPSLYPVSINVPGVTTSLTRLRLTMNLHLSALNAINVLLIGPDGRQLVLMAGVSNAPFTGALTFDTQSATAIPTSGAVAPGSYRPTSTVNNVHFPQFEGPDIVATGGDVPPPVAGGTGSLGKFIGMNPTGGWSVFIVATAAGDPDDPNKMTSMSLTIDSPPDFAIDMTQVGTFKQGDVGDRYHIVVSNMGASPTGGTVTVTDVVPAGLTATNLFGVGWTCSLTQCSRSDSLGGQASYPQIVLVVDVADNAPQSVDNTASLVDGVPGNNSVTVQTPIMRQTDLAISVDDHVSSITAGNAITYTIVATNNGPKDVPGAFVTISFSYLLNATFTATQTGGASGFTPSGSNAIFDTVNLPVGSTITYTLNATVSPSASGFPAGTYSNTAFINGPSFVLDTNTANNSATDTDTLVYDADLSIAMSAPALVASGTDLTWTVVVSNAGPSDAHNVTLTDVLPIPFVSQTQTVYNNVFFNQSNTGDTITDTAFQFPKGGSATLELVGHVPPDTLPNVAIANTATIASADDTTAGNNTSFASTQTDVPDLSITQTLAGNAFAGQPVAYTLTVSNSGGTTNGEITVSDLVSTGLTGAAIAGSGWNCTGLTCTTTNVLLPGDTSTLVLTATVDPSAPETVTSTAIVSGGSEANLSNDSASVTSTVYTPFGAPQQLVATHTSTSTATAKWRAVLGAVHYVVARDTSISGLFNTVTTVAGTELDDTGLSADTTYLYKVQAVDGADVHSAFSGIDAVTTTVFSDDPLAAGTTPIRASHINQLRIAVDAMRVAADLPKLFDGQTLLAGANVTESEITSLRAAIVEARTNLTVGAYTFTDGTITAGVTPIRTAHIADLRNACE